MPDRAKVAILAPFFTVLMDDGAVFEVQSNNWDMLTYERTGREQSWPSPQVAPVEFSARLSWLALRREALIPMDRTFDDYVTHAVTINPRTQTQDPTPAGPEVD